MLALLGMFVVTVGADRRLAAEIIDNGITGDGAFQVDVLDGGGTSSGVLDPVGFDAANIIYQYSHMVDVGNSGGVRLGDTNVTTSAFLSGTNEVTSQGNFSGQNGMINWEAVSSFASGSPIYQTALTFSSADPFGNVQLIQYLDEDIFGSSDDVLVQLGIPGANDFQLLTIDNDDNVGIAHGATYNTANGMSYTGWAADEYSDLINRIEGGTQAYSILGNVALPATTDSRYPGSPAYGSADITSAIAFNFSPTANFASVVFTLGGAPSGVAPPPPAAVPEPGSMILLGTGLASLMGYGGWRRKRRGSADVAA